MTIRTEVVPRDAVLDLRWRVLRPGHPRNAAEFAEDAREDTYHLAAFDGEGAEVLACVSLFPEPLPGDPRVAHRIRGMASAPAVRGRGFGAALLGAAGTEAALRGAELLWCNGRVEAVGFYVRHGFSVVGEEFVIEGVGPHHVMARSLTERPLTDRPLTEPPVAKAQGHGG
ncbi:GNAT family N-acetyltransferase [Streptomyces sp. PT12]|uniref:GNAT family N-acetyltransferase n=1 Tax=Streptomyces sp. PT12 TaxID=1510197 RepID=UPI000DE1D9CE|nr:GNAT family N-acetyltransferase [Streptomyces sp. PT12]RBM19040.1 GNAT family N-acetyltransferase [Streptomyces sp. PT12]